MVQDEVDAKASQQFIAHSILDLIIPEASQLDIEEALSSASANADDDAPASLASIPQRKALYFGRSLSHHARIMSYLSTGIEQMNNFPYSSCSKHCIKKKMG